ncbi:formyltetrahydrofolate deformylase [Marinomonas mediterranea]|jgi:formyltetrahydrofolate deformylase (EC 3.5.1.10)|uniref:Formyltetrahydrofolate deformylase n=1 Tax=Marinomonas mediterranea (strain ATCC 700492 / JCM 21426 / NBRC 103028 / MMB-1) TaxID=717774 RepID=F2JV08_MARM1|nr:formyltetrahydrofolate deformylase [Marinomonas mediterranea]ADZ91662.1 formyltetrahydrofolate deformylase [Marinomonas mediterranea MMB-1]WCN17762.1 formyltetrahydrofolate deformylase [Marinomonas mediterranea MMB-1]
MSHPKEFVLKASCYATSGIVATVSTYLAEHGCYISEMHQYDDEETQRFFMRALCKIESDDNTIDSIRAGLDDQVTKFNMDWNIYDMGEPVKVLLMVSKFDHCLDDLLYRHRKGELRMDITAIVSNHKDLRPMAEREGIRFIHLPVTKDNKPEQEAALMAVVEETQTDLVVLARYMQILSDSLCKQLQGRAINIHHSFLPGFKGAKPYHQAHVRGVKLIGATAHYVTSDLDEGPIIEQSVQPVDHTYSTDRLVAVGRDTETVALATAVRMHLEHRVFMYGNKTVVFK